MSPPVECTDTREGEKLAAYELGLLESDERARFEGHLCECAFCQEELFANARYASAMMSEAGAALQALQPNAEGGWLSRLASWLSPGRLVPVASFATAALVAIVYLSSRTGDELGALARLEPIAYTPIETRDIGAAAPARLFDEGMLHYVAGDYARAAQPLAEALRSAPADWGERDQAVFYLGLSRLLAGLPDAALAPLEEASRSPLPVIADRARWYLAQAHVSLGDAESALSLLRALAAGSPGYADQAAEQIEEIRAHL